MLEVEECFNVKHPFNQKVLSLFKVKQLLEFIILTLLTIQQQTVMSQSIFVQSKYPMQMESHFTSWFIQNYQEQKFNDSEKGLNKKYEENHMILH